jgi:acetoin utilization protein AcuB
MTGMTAEEIMTEDVLTIAETASLGSAYRALSELSIRHIPVVRGREVVGMLSDRDLRSIGFAIDRDLERTDNIENRLATPVSSLMSGNVLSVAPTTDVREIIDLMVEEKVGALPVIDEETNELVGLISYIDVLTALRDELD